MKIILIFIFMFLQIGAASALTIQKPKSYQGHENVNNWHMSEKLDGIRGYWNGKNLLTKNGNIIRAPKWFLQNFPPFALDGELWSKRGDFENIQSIVLDKRPSSNWKQITYQIFETPNQKGNFDQRIKKTKNWFKTHKNRYVRVIKQIKCKDKEHLYEFLKKIENLGGEGVVVKNPKLPYFTGRSAQILKVKSSHDMEGKVIAINSGRGKYKNMMGSLTIKLQNGTVFKLGTGFSQADRANPPAIGSVVTFKYYGFTKNQKPKFASFVRIRKRE